SAVTEEYGDRIYAYSGIADVIKTYDEASDTTTYSFALRTDVKFSDGENLNADDVIFTLYLHLDPMYSGSWPLQDSGIIGAINYHYDNSSADNITKERIDEVLASEELKPLILENIIVPTLRTQYDSVRSMFDDSSYSIYTSKYPTPVELFAFFYAINLKDANAGKYSAKGKDAPTVIAEIADMYDGNYRQLASMTMGDETYFDDEARNLAISYIAKQSGETEVQEETESVSSVSGIVKTGPYSVQITASGRGEELERALSEMTIVPMHYYGNEALYSYKDDMFGFMKGKAEQVLSSNADKPVGAGAYRYIGTFSGEADFCANEHYYKGTPAAGTVTLVEKGEMSAAELISEGIVDICDDDGSADSSAAIDEANRSMEKISASISTEPGYGYIGINANTVCIGDQFSDKSYALRKALATVFAAYRDESVTAYFGAFGQTTDYPVIEDIVMDKNAEGYTVPYSRNKNGDQIVVSGMNSDEKKAAVKQACLGYLADAGYVISGDKVTDAPYGGTKEFNAIVVAGGNGQHPCYTALKKAAEILHEIGLTLNITDTADANELWEALNNGTNEIWAGAWNTESLSTVYVGSYYGADSTKLKLIIKDAEAAEGEDKRAQFMKCYDKVHNTYAVEVPMYIKTKCTLFSTLRIESETFPTDLSDCYSWADEAANITPKQR
ncbi:MAG: hypothetical protein IK093_03855, partial [Ruminiclostridium sp.]|nr:hypothetical protein [Ruminiclostridium sp.]